MENIMLVGRLNGEPIENFETGLIELKVNVKNYNNLLVKADAEKFGKKINKHFQKDSLIGFRGRFESAGQVIAEKLYFFDEEDF